MQKIRIHIYAQHEKIYLTLYAYFLTKGSIQSSYCNVMVIKELPFNFFVDCLGMQKMTMAKYGCFIRFVRKTDCKVNG